MFELDRARIERARELFHPCILDRPHSLVTAFSCVGASILVRAHTAQEALSQAGHLYQYASFRKSELFSRLELLNWMQREFESRREEESAPWSNFAALVINDFHTGLASLMDAVAATIVQATGACDLTSKDRLPGFAEIQASGDRRPAGRFRDRIPPEILAVVDSTDRWWPAVREVRHRVVHREHTTIVFGGAVDPVLFQIYFPGEGAQILDPVFLWTGGKNVANFRLYSAAVLAELLVFLDELGKVLADHHQLASLTRCQLSGDFSYLMEPMDQLIQRLSARGTDRVGP